MADVQADEHLARSGSPEEVADRYRVEGSMLGGGIEGITAQEAVADDHVDSSQFGEDDSTPARAPVDRESAKPQSNEGAVTGAAKAAPVEVVKRRTINRPGVPTPAQAVAGNYPKAHKSFDHTPVTVETGKGQVRKGVDADGNEWSVKMPTDYGYIKRTEGADGEHIDVFLGPHKSSAVAGNVYVVNQKDPVTGKFDEHKVMLGFDGEESAMDAYVGAFSDGSGASRIQSVEVMTVSEFNQWLKSPQSKPAKSDTSLVPEPVPSEGNAPAGWDHVDNLAGGYLETQADIRAAATRITTAANAMVGARLRGQTSMEPITKVAVGAVSEAIRPLISDVPVLYLDTQDIMRMPWVLDAISEGRLTGPPSGFYDPASDSIVMNNGAHAMRGPDSEMRLLVHEGLHAALYNVINNSPRARNAAQSLLDQVKMWNPNSRAYGLTNVHEFISEAMSNHGFQTLLANTPVDPTTMRDFPRGGSTLWERFKNFVHRFLPGVSDNALDSVLRMTEHLTNIATTEGRRGNNTGYALYAPNVPGAVQDHAKATASWAKRLGYKLSTLHYIGQMNKDMFVDAVGDALKDTINAIQRMTPRSRQLQEESHALAVKFLEWGAKNREQAHAMSELAVDATMLNVNLVNDANWASNGSLDAANTHLGKDAARGWQAKANLKDLQRQFMKLPAEARAIWEAQTKYYKDTQNKVIRTSLNSLLNDFASNGRLTQAQVDDLVNKTMAGTLTDADGTLLGNTAIFNNLKSALTLKQLEGTYFPLMRFGNHVVKTRLKTGDLMGGNLIAPDTVEFRAADDKTARAMAKKFAGDTSMPVTSTKKTYFERATGKQLSAADATGQVVDHVYRVRVQRDGLFMFDSGPDAQRFIRESGSEFDQISGVMEKAGYNTDNTLKAGQLAALMGAVRGDKNLSDARKLEIEQALHQVAARLLPGNRIQKRTIQRKNTVGASNDLARALLAYGQSSSGYLARSEFLPKIREGLSRMRAIQADKTDISKDAVPRSQTIAELEKRISGNVETVYEPNRLVQDLMTLSFMDKLFSPAYSLLNAMQVMMTTHPYLSGKFGAAQSALHLQRAYSAVGLGTITLDGIKNTATAIKDIKAAALDTRDVIGDIKKRIAKQPDGVGLLAMMTELQARGALDDGALFEIASAVEGGRGVWGTGLARVDRVARQLPAAIEQLNRAVASIASYRLATQKGKTHAEAMEFAFDTTMLTQFDYSNSNSSTIFNSGLAKVALQFKKYAANMAVLLYDMTQRAFKGASVDERKEGRRALAQLVAVQIATAGALSLPGLELIKVFAMVGAVLGVGGGYDDIERWLRKTAEAHLGKTGAEALLRGLPRLAGIDLSGRLSLADMFLFGEPKTFDQEGWQAYAFRLMSGAPVGYVADLIAATGDIAKGDYSKAAEKIIPNKLIVDTLKARRQYGDGDLNAAQAASQAFGIRPAVSARKSEEIGDRMAARKDKEDEKKLLERRYMNGSKLERVKLVKEIKAYNDSEGVTFRTKISTGAMNRRIKAIEDKRAGRPNPDNKEY